MSRYEVQLGAHAAVVDVRLHPEGGWWVALDGADPVHLRGGAVGAAEWRLDGDGQHHSVAVHVDGERLSVQSGGHGLSGTVVDPRDRALDALSTDAHGEIVTPMPGAVVRVLVAAGAEVTAGQVLVVVEAMKMENEFKAPAAGVVEAVHVQAGSSVDAGALLVSVRTEEGA